MDIRSTVPKGEISLLSSRPYMQKNGEEQGRANQKEISVFKQVIDQEVLIEMYADKEVWINVWLQICK